MAQRLKTLETQASVLQKELKQKSQRLITAEDKIASLQHDLKCSNEEKEILASKIARMNAFLADYGLVWAGDNEATTVGAATAGSSGAAAPQPPINIYDGEFRSRTTVAGAGGEEPLDPRFLEAAGAAHSQQHEAQRAGHPRHDGSNSASTQHSGLPFDLQDFLSKAESLTGTAGFSGVKIVGRQAGIKERQTVHVCIYSDGISVNSGPFRPYGWPLCDAFLGDILDGYFPYEFKDKYPDGFPISVIDRSTQPCPTAATAAGGAQQQQGVRSMLDQKDHGHQPLTREELLRRLPQQHVTAGGMLINPREGIEKLLGVPPAATSAAVNPDEPIICPTPAGDQAKADPGTPNVTSIQVRLPSGRRALLHLYFDNTVGDLKNALVRSLPAEALEKGRRFDISTVFPRRTYDDEATTMEAAGLVPNCLVHVRYNKA